MRSELEPITRARNKQQSTPYISYTPTTYDTAGTLEGGNIQGQNNTVLAYE